MGKMVLLKILRKIKRKEREMRLLMLYGMCVCDCECLEGVLEKVPCGMLFLSPCVWSSIRCACALARMVVQWIGQCGQDNHCEEIQRGGYQYDIPHAGLQHTDA